MDQTSRVMRNREPERERESEGGLSRQREPWVDNLRVALIAGVIVVHVATGYVVDIAGWYYDDELRASGPLTATLAGPAVFGALFALGPLFLLGGWLAARSLAHHDSGAFARSRLLRLGLPLVLFVVLVEPLANYLGNLRQEGHSVRSYFTQWEVAQFWFVAALLVFSLVHAGFTYVRGRVAAGSPKITPRSQARSDTSTLALAALVIAASSFLVWLVWPLEAERYFLKLRLGAWPQGAVLFALGAHRAGGATGWIGDRQPLTRRRLGWIAAASTSALVTLFAVGLGLVKDDEVVTRGDLRTAMFALLYGSIAVSLTLWIVGVARDHWTGRGRLLQGAGRASYATYFIHPLVLTLLMILLRPVALAPGWKFVIVSATGVPLCFLAGYWMTRLPGVSKVL
jgi:glucans biosynthesis protein C